LKRLISFFSAGAGVLGVVVPELLVPLLHPARRARIMAEAAILARAFFMWYFSPHVR
jgi:hypothetical protein